MSFMDGTSGVWKKDSVHAIAIEILKENGSSMTIKEITKLVLKQREIKSKTPYNSVNSVLQRSKFTKKAGLGKYELIESSEPPENY